MNRIGMWRCARWLLMVASASLALSSVGSTTAGPARTGGTLRFAVSAAIGNTSLAGFPYVAEVYQSMFNTLTVWDAQTYEPRPELAESWTLSPDGLEWTFNLRRGVTWHDGKPFTSADVKFTVETVLDRRVSIAGYHRSTLQDIVSVTTAGDHVVRFRMRRPAPDFPTVLPDRLHMFPKHLLEGVDMNAPRAFLLRPIGTGPFKFSSHFRGEKFVVTANDNYFKGRPTLDSVVYRILPDANSQIVQFKLGELDYSHYLGPAQIKALENEPGLRVRHVEELGYWHIFFNNASPLLRDRRVRQALTLGLNREQILNQVMGGRGVLAAGPVSPLLKKWRNTSLKPYPFDPTRAKALLNEAGWVDSDNDGILDKEIEGRRVPFRATIMVIPIFSALEDIALIAQQQWKALGLDITLERQETNTGIAKRTAGNFTFFVGTRNPAPSIVDVQRYFGCGAGGNRVFYCNEQLDEQVNLALNAKSAIVRKAASDRAQVIAHEDAPTLFMFYFVESQVLSRRVVNAPEVETPRLMFHLDKIGVNN